MSYAGTANDLLGMVTRSFTPDVVKRAASRLGEDPERTRSAITAAVPSVLASLSQVATSDQGVTHLKQMIDARPESASAEAGAPLFDGGGASARIDEELVPHSASIAAAVARTSGIKPESAQTLLAGATSIAIGTLAKFARGMSPSSLKRLFLEQREGWVGRLPAPVASLFGGGARTQERVESRAVDTQQVRSIRREGIGGPAVREVGAKHRTWWPILAAIALVLIGWPLVRRMMMPAHVRHQLSPVAQAPTVPSVGSAPLRLPNGQMVDIAPGSTTRQLADFLAGPEAAPRRFTLSPLNFAFGATVPDNESMATVNELGAILRAYPSAQIRLESHTDSVGNAEANQALSEQRSESVKRMLVERGVSSARIDTAGMGQSQPVAANGTDEERKQNRRTDVLVTTK
ncbi:MAG TPA: OmpA family protein [Polyangia bacterium]|nr:OmpA family protein [Polyangia bacterium]